MSYYEGFDLEELWTDSDYSRQKYILPPPTEIAIAATEKRLGFKLPDSFIELMRHQNGGVLKKSSFPTAEPTSWAEDHVAIHGVFGIGDSKANSLCGELGSQFMIDEWGYPRIGVYFGDCPSAGHDMICLDYRNRGPSGEPRVVHVDQEFDYKITVLADSFEDFIKGLVSDDCFEVDDDLDDSNVGFVWRTQAISAAVVQVCDEQHLHLEQSLAPSESGWTTMRISLPRNWKVSEIAVAEGTVRMEVPSVGAFELTSENVGQLSFEILDGGGKKSDVVLESIWTKYAAGKT